MFNLHQVGYTQRDILPVMQLCGEPFLRGGASFGCAARLRIVLVSKNCNHRGHFGRFSQVCTLLLFMQAGFGLRIAVAVLSRRCELGLSIRWFASMLSNRVGYFVEGLILAETVHQELGFCNHSQCKPSDWLSRGVGGAVRTVQFAVCIRFRSLEGLA